MKIQKINNDFPGFMKNEINRIDSKYQSSDKIEGYVYDGIDGSQITYWKCYDKGYSPEHTHEYDEYMIVVQGKYTIINGNERIEVNAGEEVIIPKTVPHAGEYIENTRTIHAFGGKRANRKIIEN
ncbi:cupin domain-containing protein [bacterium]|nr:cupin domain-containing protein [bacterium]RQV99551.1 MAG: cupin domain-containing protein [bacterium]